MRRPRPRINKKPAKGMKQFLKQNRIIKALKSIISKKKQWWYTSAQTRAMWLASHSRSRYKPHQGPQEKARRVRQMERGIIK